MMETNEKTATRTLVFYLSLFFFFSGFCGLIYQIVWTRLLSLLFGHTTFAISTVITAFMGGLAWGSFYFGRLADREKEFPAFLKQFGSSSLFLMYGLLEGAIGIYCLITPLLFQVVEIVYLPFSELPFPVLSLIRFLLCALVLIFPTFLMGGTLPLLSKFYIQNRGEMSPKLGFLYFINTIGAAVGAFLAGFFMIRLRGLHLTLLIAALINLIIGLAVYRLTSRGLPGFIPLPSRTEKPPVISGNGNQPPPLSLKILFGVFAFTGFASMIYEICWTRALALALGSSTYAFTTMLSTFLFGLAAGSLLYSRCSRKRSFGLLTFGWLEVSTGIACLLSVFLLGEMPLYFISIFPFVKSSYLLVLAADFLLSFLAMLIPTLLIGFIFPLAGQLYTAQFQQLGRRLGEIYAINTVGCILGAFTTAFIFIPLWGVQTSLQIAVSINLLSGTLFILRSNLTRLKKLTATLVILPALVYTAAMPSWNPNIMNSGAAIYTDRITKSDLVSDEKKDNLLFNKDGITSTISVYREGKDIYLKVNGKTDASTSGDLPTQLLLGYLPVLYHPQPEEVFIIGLGSGITAKAVLDFPHIRSVTCAELEPEVIEANRFFAPYNGHILNNPRFKIKTDDGRNALLASTRKTDIIISEPSNPWIAGVANLFTREFYQISKARLNPGGIFCQWLQLYGIEPEDVIMILKTFYSVFPHGVVWRGLKGDLILLGSDKALILDYAAYARRFRENKAFKKSLQEIQIDHPDTLFAHYLVDASQLGATLRTAPFNSDNLPLLEFSAPRSLYADTETRNLRGLYQYKTHKVPESIGFPENQSLPVGYYLALYRDLGEVFLESMLQEAGRLYPDNVEISLLKVKTLIKNNQIIPAESFLKAMIARGLDDYRLPLELARLHFRQGMKEEAEKGYQRTYGFKGKTVEVPREWLITLIDLKKLDKALAVSQRAQKDFPEDLELEILRGTILGRSKKLDEALTVIKALLQKIPDNKITLKNLFFLYQEQNDTPNQIRTGERFIRIHGPDRDILLELGKAYIRTGNKTKAREILNLGLDIDPYNKDLNGLLGGL